jgi:glucose uptake protein
MRRADPRHLPYVILGGVIFNVANLLLVAAIEIAGMATAFPIGIGLALVVGVVLNYILSPKGSLLLLIPGVLLVVAAILLDARAYSLRESKQSKTSRKGITISVACGVLGLFYPFLAEATAGERSLGPYAVAFVFSISSALSALVMNTILMARPISGSERVRFSRYLSARPFWHVMGLLGGAIWCTGLVFNFVASHAQIVGLRCLLRYRPGRYDGIRDLGSFRVTGVRQRACGCKESPALHVPLLRCGTRNDCSRAAVSLILGPGDCF